MRSKIAILTLSMILTSVCSTYGQEKFLEVENNRRVTTQPYGDTYLFTGEVLKEKTDFGPGKVIYFFDSSISLYFSTKSYEDKPDGFHYIKLYETNPERNKTIGEKYRDLDITFRKSLYRQIVNGTERVFLDLTELDSFFNLGDVYLANKLSASLRLVNERKGSVEYKNLEDTFRIVPIGYPTIFLAKADIEKKEPAINDTTVYTLFNGNGGQRFLREVKDITKYFRASQDFKPLPLEEGEYALQNGKVLTKINGQWQQLEKQNLPLPLWALISLGVVLVVSLVLIYLFFIKRIHLLRHKVESEDRLATLEDQYSQPGHRVEKTKIIKLNHKFLEGLNPGERNKRLVEYNPEVEGREIIIPISKRLYKKDQSRDNHYRQLEENQKESSERSESKQIKNEGIAENYSQIISKLTRIESLLSDQGKLEKEQEFRRINDLNSNLQAKTEDYMEKTQRLEIDIHKIESERDHLNSELREKKSELQQLSANQTELQDENQSLNRQLAKAKSVSHSMRERALYFTKEGQSFAKNRILLLEKGLGAWQELYKLLNESYQMVHSQEESQGLSLILFKEKSIHAIQNAQISLSQLQTLRESGIWSDPDHVRKLKQTKEESDKLNFIEKSLVQSVLGPFLSEILIALEEAKCLSRILNKRSDMLKRAEHVGNGQQDIIRLSEDLLGIKVDYVPLFSAVSDYTQVRAIDRSVSPLYSNLELDKNHILEIESYGIGFNGQNSSTKVIIKR